MTPPRPQRSHDRKRTPEQRRRDIRVLPSADLGGPRTTDHRVGRVPNRALTALARAVAGERGSTGSDLAASPGAAEVARLGLKLYRALIKELGGTKSTTARAHALTYGLLAASAQQLVLEAGAAGLASQRGVELLDAATRLAGRAERSATSALSLAGLLDRRAPDQTSSALARILAAGGKDPQP